MDEQTSELVARSRAGDREAYGQLVAVCQEMALATGRRLLGNHHDAMDVVQESFLLAWVRLGQLQDDRKFEPWLRTIIQRSAMSLIRQRASRQRMEAQAEAMRRRPPGDGTEQPERLLDRLPNQLREPVVLHYVYNWPYQRIAKHLQMPVTTVKGRLQQARRRLRPGPKQDTTGEPPMRSTPLSEKVHEAIRHIETREFHEVIPLQGARNVVLFCGMLSDVELCQTDGDAVVINGTKACLAPTPESAQEMLSDIKLQADRVDDYRVTGPHESMLFWGTNRDKDGNPIANAGKASDLWRSRAANLVTGTPSLSDDSRRCFPDMAQPSSDIEPMLRNMALEALRISVTRDRIRDVVIPEGSIPEQAKRLIRINSTDGKLMHGDTGRISMTVAVPAGCGVVVMANSVHAGGLHNDLVLCRPDTSTIEQIDGNVAVLDGCAQEVSDIRGRFIQTWYGLGGQQSDDGIGYRRTSGIATETLRSIGGGADVDCFKANLTCEDLRGAVRVRNVLGTTTAILATHQQGDRLKLQTDSGRICIRLDGQLAEQLRVKLACAAGQVAIPALAKLRQDGRLNNGNDTNLMWFATRGDRWESALQEDDQDILAVSRDGTITVEPLEAPVTSAG